MGVTPEDGYPPMLLLGVPGVGLSLALTAFRRYGYTAVQDVPPAGLASLVAALQSVPVPCVVAPRLRHDDAALSADSVKALKAQFPQVKVLVLEATPATVTHRRLADDSALAPVPSMSGLVADVAAESAVVADLKPLADYHIETTNLEPAELKAKIAVILGLSPEEQSFTVFIQSFGFKYGVPHDAEMVFDVRYMKNPFYEPALRPMSGLDQPVKDYLLSLPDTVTLQQQWLTWLEGVIPAFRRQGRTRLSIAIGCTGGQHRSVFMSQALATVLGDRFPNIRVVLNHREEPRWRHLNAPATQSRSTTPS